MPETGGSAGGCTRVLIVDDHPLFREAVRAWLSREPDLRVCGEAGTLADARRLCDELAPDLVMLDLHLPDGDGLGLIEESRDWKTPPTVIVVTVRGEDDPVAVEAIRRGASAFLCKRTTGEQMLAAIRQASSGQTYMGPGLIEQLLRRNR